MPAEQEQTMKEAIESLFEVTDLFASSGDASNRADMSQKQMAFGTLLQSCGLMKWSKDKIEEKVASIKCELDKSTEVLNTTY